MTFNLKNSKNGIVETIILGLVLATVICIAFYSYLHQRFPSYEEIATVLDVPVEQVEQAAASNDYGIPEDNGNDLTEEQITANESSQNTEEYSSIIDDEYVTPPEEVSPVATTPECLELSVVSDCVLPARDMTNIVANTYRQWDRAYGTLGGQQQKMDISWPKAEGRFPLVIMIHGGGWMTGDKEDFRDEIQLLASQGYVAASVNYRLAREEGGQYYNTFPAAIEDVRCSVRWLKQKADGFKIDTSRVLLMGTSAGGHLAALAGFADWSLFDSADCPFSESQYSSRVQGVISYYGPTDIRAKEALTSENQRVIFLGGQPKDLVDLATQASPYMHVDAADPPILFVHPEFDQTVSVTHSIKMANKIADLGGPYLFIKLGNIGGVNHGTYWIKPFSESPTLRTATCTSWEFLDTILK